MFALVISGATALLAPLAASPTVHVAAYATRSAPPAMQFGGGGMYDRDMMQGSMMQGGMMQGGYGMRGMPGGYGDNRYGGIASMTTMQPRPNRMGAGHGMPPYGGGMGGMDYGRESIMDRMRFERMQRRGMQPYGGGHDGRTGFADLGHLSGGSVAGMTTGNTQGMGSMGGYAYGPMGGYGGGYERY